MAWTTRDRKIQRRAERRGTGRARRITDEDRAAASAWAARFRDGKHANAPEELGEPGGPVAFRQAERDGHPGYLIAGRWYRGHESDRIAAQREDAVLVRRSYGEADGDGLWRNVVLYDLRPEARWRRIDLAWSVQRECWRRCQGLTEARVSAPELLAWAEGEVRTWPRTLSERITAAEEAVGAMTQGGEVSAAITRSLAFEHPVLGAAPRGRPRKEHG
jgi:hypothetical protein